MKRTDYTSLKHLVTAVPVPAQTATYKPVSNAQLIDLTLAAIDGAGFTLGKEAYTLVFYLSICYRFLLLFLLVSYICCSYWFGFFFDCDSLLNKLDEWFKASLCQICETVLHVFKFILS